MNRQYPVYTVATECQDCCKCVRQCPVKAIKIENSRATVVPERCIACGHCVSVCPAGAKRVRNDVGRVRHLLDSGRPVYVSLAPSHGAAFPGLEAKQLVQALLKLGFAGVSETAIGAEQVTQATAAELVEGERRLVLSTACPSVVQFVRKYLPELAGALSALPSPALSHAAFLQERYADAAVVFVGPCIAKKLESDDHPERIAVALTYDELRAWLRDEGIDPFSFAVGEGPGFVPEAAARGRLFPAEGGMLRAGDGWWPGGWQGVALAGIPEIDRQLAGLDPDSLPCPAFLELLACPGGCLNGPACRNQGNPLAHWLAVLQTGSGACRQPRPDPVPLLPERIRPVRREDASASRLRMALAKVGKTSPEDELNCGGCGYATCRDFARALLDGRAEPSMCLSHLRQQAQRKANALLRCMPAGVVVVDEHLTVIECNRVFARMFGEEAMLAYEAQPGLGGADLTKLLPFADLFATVLRTGEDIHRPGLRSGERILDLTVFPIEPGRTAGAVLTDVTRTELRREQIAERAGEVIRKNLLTVQEVACRLGENMAETEILLRSLAKDYSAHAAPDEPTDAERLGSLCNWEKAP